MISMYAAVGITIARHKLAAMVARRRYAGRHWALAAA